MPKTNQRAYRPLSAGFRPGNGPLPGGAGHRSRQRRLAHQTSKPSFDYDFTSFRFRARYPVLLAGFLLLSTTACTPPSSGPESGVSFATKSLSGFPRSIETIDGKITIPSLPRRIVSQTLFTDEVLLELCPRDRLVGIHPVSLDPAFSNVAETVSRLKLQTVRSSERIISLEPDLVFVASFSRAEVVDQLRRGCRAPIVRFSDFASLEDVRQNIRAVGYLIGEETAAEELIGAMDRRIQAVVSGIPSESSPPSVVSFGPGGYTAGSGTLFDDVLTTIGAINLSAANGIEQFGQIGIEQVAFWDPDWVVCGVDPGSEESTRKWFYENAVLKTTRAAKKGHLLLVPNRLYTSTSHHLASLIEYLARNFYGTGLSDG